MDAAGCWREEKGDDGRSEMHIKVGRKCEYVKIWKEDGWGNNNEDKVVTEDTEQEWMYVNTK